MIDDPRRTMIERLSIMYAIVIPGPWETYQNGVHPRNVGGMGSGEDYAVLTHGPRAYNTANWIAAIHNEWPMLLELIREAFGDQTIGRVPAGLDDYIAALRKRDHDMRNDL